MKRIWIALFLTLCLLVPCLAAAEGAPAAELWEPVVEADTSLSTGQAALWDCVTFGSYPQTEIVAAPSSAVDDYAVRDGDFCVDPDLYEQLVHAEWAGNTAEIGSVRYLRMGREDAVTASSDSSGHYRWGEGEEYHYFRFDPIRWRVIALEDGNACLMADRLLDCQPYHAESGPVTWETSTIRSWLNGYPAESNAAGIDYQGKGFLDLAFTDAEREAILPVPVENKPNPRYGTDCGNDTEDRVFLLSNDEVFSSDAAARNGFYAGSGYDDPAKRFRSTMYAKCRGAWWSSVNGYMGNSFWFMRTNGYTRESVTYICDFGYIYSRGTISTCGDAGVLPALWVRLDLAELAPAEPVSSREIGVGASRSTDEDPRGRDRIVNPIVQPDPEEPDGKSVTYSLVRFGSYPQAEVTPESDGSLYGALESAGWNNDEYELDGVRYLRVISEGDGETPSARYFACEPLLWRALEVRDGTVLLLSHTAVECRPFHAELAEVSWESCTLRSWLNGYGADANAAGIDYSGAGDSFLDTAFSPAEREAILERPVRNENNYYFGMDSGAETADRVFILAESELFVYDSSVIHGFSPRDEIADRAKQFKPTGWALLQGAWVDAESGNVFWITRTTGYTHANVVYVDESGYMYNRGILVTCRDAAVIPALVLDLDAQGYEYAGTFTIASP